MDEKKSGPFEKVLQYIGVGIGIISVFLTDSVFLATILTVVLFFAGSILGSVLDQRSKGERSTKSIFKPILVTVVILALFLSLFSMCSGGSGKQSAKDKYGMDFYDTPDGKRIWVYTS